MSFRTSVRVWLRDQDHETGSWKRTPNGYELGQPKTRRSVRTINVPALVLAGLDFSHDWLFTNTEGGPIRLYSWRTNVWVPSLAKARLKEFKNPDKALLEKQPRIHDLRHTCASWLLGAGVPLITVSAHLGHEDAATTARIYGHLDRSAGQAAAEAIANLLRYVAERHQYDQCAHEPQHHD